MQYFVTIINTASVRYASQLSKTAEPNYGTAVLSTVSDVWATQSCSTGSCFRVNCSVCFHCDERLCIQCIGRGIVFFIIIIKNLWTSLRVIYYAVINFGKPGPQEKFWAPLMFSAQNHYKFYHWSNINLFSLTNRGSNSSWTIQRSYIECFTPYICVCLFLIWCQYNFPNKLSAR